MIQPTTIRNSANSRAVRTLLVLASFSVLGLPTLAASAGSGSQTQALQEQKQAQKNDTAGQGQTSQEPDQRGQGQMGQRGAADRTANLDVSYYSGDPLKGGKLISTVKLTPPPQTVPSGERQTAGQRQNPVAAQAPKNATFAVIKDARGGARIIDLAQLDQQQGGQGGRGGPRSQDGMPPQR